MNRTVKLALALVVPAAMTGIVLTAPAAHADDRICRGTIGSQQLDGNVIVPKGASCTLAGTRIDGNVFVRGDAQLLAKGVKIGGNIQAENHKSVIVRHREVDGQVQRSRIEGSIQLKQGGGGELRRTVVNADIQLFSNTGLFEVRGNVVGGNLQCKSNDPQPVGGNNTVEGNKEDQCQNL
jgi:hypothetical protein